MNTHKHTILYRIYNSIHATYSIQMELEIENYMPIYAGYYSYTKYTCSLHEHNLIQFELCELLLCFGFLGHSPVSLFIFLPLCLKPFCFYLLSINILAHTLPAPIIYRSRLSFIQSCTKKWSNSCLLSNVT